MSCDVGEVTEKFENEQRVSFDVGEVTEKLQNEQSSFSNSYIALPTSQLILQLLRRITYVTAHTTALPLLHLRHRHFTYVTAHSLTLPSLHLRHSSFYNPSTASPTSQVILQPFRCFIYVTGISRIPPGDPSMHRGMKNSLW